MSLEADYLEAFETHSPDGIRSALAAGASATELIKGKTTIDRTRVVDRLAGTVEVKATERGLLSRERAPEHWRE
jgi:hypothetical protein